MLMLNPRCLWEEIYALQLRNLSCVTQKDRSGHTEILEKAGSSKKTTRGKVPTGHLTGYIWLRKMYEIMSGILNLHTLGLNKPFPWWLFWKLECKQASVVVGPCVNDNYVMLADDCLLRAPPSIQLK